MLAACITDREVALNKKYFTRKCQLKFHICTHAFNTFGQIRFTELYFAHYLFGVIPSDVCHLCWFFSNFGVLKAVLVFCRFWFLHLSIGSLFFRARKYKLNSTGLQRSLYFCNDWVFHCRFMNKLFSFLLNKQFNFKYSWSYDMFYYEHITLWYIIFHYVITMIQ